MKCPICNNSDSRVLDSRPVEDGSRIKRRRECPSCGKRFTTYEVIDTVPIAVVKRSGKREFTLFISTVISFCVPSILALPKAVMLLIIVPLR